MPQDDRKAGNLGAARQQENIPGKANPASLHTKYLAGEKTV